MSLALAVTAASCHLRDLRTRLPFRYGAVTLTHCPLLLLAVDLYLRRDAGLGRAALRIAPHAALAVAAFFVHVGVARSAGYVAPFGSPLALLGRIPHALVAAQFYPWKFVWPVPLAIEYDVEGWLRSRWCLAASSLVFMSATLCDTAWNLPIGWPNCERVRA